VQDGSITGSESHGLRAGQHAIIKCVGTKIADNKGYGALVFFLGTKVVLENCLVSGNAAGGCLAEMEVFRV